MRAAALIAALLPAASCYQLVRLHAPRQLPATLPHAARLRPPLLLNEPNEPPADQSLERSDGSGAGGAGGAVKAWVRENVLQGVEPSVETYTVMTVYFVQGVLGLAALARTFLFKDQFGLSPAESAALLGITSLPWVIKPVYGFLSDGLPLFGYRRKSYLTLAGIIGTTSWLALATVVQTPAQAVLASTLASLGVAVSDVVVDSLVVERARDDESAGSGALQSLCWSCQSVGALTSAYFSGSLLEAMSPQQVFGITAIFPLLVVLMSTQLNETPQRPGDAPPFSQLVQSQGALLWQAASQRNVWMPALFLCLWQATPSSESAYFYFLTGPIGIGPEFMGRVRVGSSIASLLGILAYRRWLQEVPIKQTLFWTALASAPLGLTQLLLVTGLNRELGISDLWFTFGDSLVLSVLGQLAFMPLLVLAASLCPPGVEGTLFALLMSLFNGAGILGNELGALLTEKLGVTESDFSNLALLVTICNLSSLLPLLAINWLDAAPGAAPAADGRTGDAEVEMLEAAIVTRARTDSAEGGLVRSGASEEKET